MTTSAPPNDEELARQVTRALALPDAPAQWVCEAQALFTAPTTVADVAQAALRIVMAVLSFDSTAQPAVALGMRSVGEGPRHLLFSAEGRDIDLRVHAGDGRFALSGQVLGPDEEGIVELSCADDAAATPCNGLTTTLDAMGEFRLDDIPAGTWRVALCLGSDRIVLPPIEAGGPGA